jgi:hypothetical protein
MSGIRTILKQTSGLSDDVLVHYNGTLMRQSLGDLARQLATVTRMVNFDTLDLLLADDTLLYDSDDPVSAGDILRAQEISAAFKVAASAATDHHAVTAGGIKLYILAGSDGSMNVMAWGAKRDGVTDDSAVIQAAAYYCHENNLTLLVPGSGYYLGTTTLEIECPVKGSIQRRFAGGATTFVSDVGAGVFAIEIVNYDGRMDGVTLRNTGAGNGIWCKLCGTAVVLKDVSTSTTYTRVTGSGSIGIAFGSEDNPGQQAITGTYDTVNSRDYDICFDMRYYSNSNTYRQLYALATNNAVQPATAGFRVNGRGGTFITCNAESNFNLFLDEQGGAGGAEENTYLNFWAEGVPGGEINLQGSGSLMINPYGFVGGAGNVISIPINKGPYARVMKSKPGGVNISHFSGQGGNMLRNAGFENGLGGLNWGSYVEPSGSTLMGFKSLTVRNTGAATSITVDHIMNYIDLDQHSWMRGKTITMVCFGQAETGVNMSIRGIVRTAAASSLQYATSEPFPDDATGIQRISFNIPEDPALSKYIVFRIYASGVTSGSPSVAGEIAAPLVYLGNDLIDMTPKLATDGANTFYGTQTIHGGGFDEAHLALGSHHLWVDASGVLRIKDGVPSSDTDGTVVGAQS